MHVHLRSFQSTDSLHCWLRSPSRRRGSGRTEAERTSLSLRLSRARVTLYVLPGCLYRAGAVAAVRVVAGQDLELIRPGFQVQFHSDH